MIIYESYNQAIPSGFVVFDSDMMVAGINHRVKEALTFVKAKNLWLEFERDYTNPSDSNAIKIIGCSKALLGGIERHFIGFVPRGIAKYISQSKFYDKVQPILSNILANDYTVENIFLGNIEIKFHIIGPVELYQTYQTATAYNELIFHLNSVNRSILQICEVGDIVSLWVKPDKSGVVVFTNKGGLMGGEGKMGYVPRHLQERIIENISKGGLYNSEIISISDESCEIKNQELTPEEVKRIGQEAMDRYYKRIADEISKPYKPKGSFNINFGLMEEVRKSRKKPKNGDIIHISTREKECYLSNLDDLEIDILDRSDRILGKLTFRTDCIRILRCLYSDYLLEIKVINIHKNGLVALSVTPSKKAIIQ